jgi:hypothetical protein
MGVAIPNLASAEPGDLVAFGNPVEHIGIYVGNGQMINSPHTGTQVQVDPVSMAGTPTAIRRVLSGAASSSGGLVSELDGSGTTGIGSSFSVPTSGPTSLSAYAKDFASAGSTTGVPTELLSAVAKTESGGDPEAVSSAGAEGLMQIMPGTAQGLGINPWDPGQAIQGAAGILAANYKKFGSWTDALAAYNAGAGAVEQYSGVPPYSQTENYVSEVLASAGMAEGS